MIHESGRWKGALKSYTRQEILESFTRQKNWIGYCKVTFLIGNGNGKDYQTDYLTNADQAIPN